MLTGPRVVLGPNNFCFFLTKETKGMEMFSVLLKAGKARCTFNLCFLQPFLECAHAYQGPVG